MLETVLGFVEFRLGGGLVDLGLEKIQLLFQSLNLLFKGMDLLFCLMTSNLLLVLFRALITELHNIRVLPPHHLSIGRSFLLLACSIINSPYQILTHIFLFVIQNLYIFTIFPIIL